MSPPDYELSVKPNKSMTYRLTAIGLSIAFLMVVAIAAEPAPPAVSASELATRLNDWQQDGSSNVRLRMEVKQPAGATALQIQIKARRTKAATDVVYQVLWPKERKG